MEHTPGQVTMGSYGDLFKGSSKVLIKQEWAAIEACSFEAKNRYRISIPQGGNEEGDVFLHMNEASNCLERMCCSANRALTLKVHNGKTKNDPVVMQFSKPFHCQGCCFMRPHFDVFAGESINEGSKIGSIDDPYKCCLMDQQILDKGGKVLASTKGSVCQIGMCCPLCFDVSFDILKNDTKVGEIKKPALNLTEGCCGTNRFLVDFQSITDQTERNMIFAAAMLLDLEYFEQNKNNNALISLVGFCCCILPCVV